MNCTWSTLPLALYDLITIYLSQQPYPIRAERQRREARRWEHPKMCPLKIYPGPTILPARPCCLQQNFDRWRMIAEAEVNLTVGNCIEERGLSNAVRIIHRSTLCAIFITTTYFTFSNCYWEHTKSSAVLDNLRDGRMVVRSRSTRLCKSSLGRGSNRSLKLRGLDKKVKTVILVAGILTPGAGQTLQCWWAFVQSGTVRQTLVSATISGSPSFCKIW